MGEQCVLTHDVGTSGDKATLVGTSGKILGVAEKDYDVNYPEPGWAEQDPKQYWDAVVETTKALLKKTKTNPKDVIGISLDAQMMGAIPVDKNGNALRPAMIWLDARSQKQSAEFEKKFDPISQLLDMGNLPMTTAKDVIPKIWWIRDNEPKVFEKAYKWCDVKDYVIRKLVGEFYTDWSTALLFGLFHIQNHVWVDQIIEGVGLSRDKLCEVTKTTDVIGTLTKEAARELGLTTETPVICGAGDAPATHVGSGAIKTLEGHLYLGSSGWVSVAMDNFAVDPETGIATIYSGVPGKFMLIGEMESVAAPFKWFRDNLAAAECQIATERGCDPYDVINEEAAAVGPGAKKLIFLPWMLGERAPIQDTTVRGGFINLSFHHGPPEIARAILEGVAYHIRWITKNIQKVLDRGVLDPNQPKPEIKSLNACGGGAVSPLWMQIFADVLSKRIRPIREPRSVAAIGIAIISMVGLKIYSDFETAVDKIIKVEKDYYPNENLKPVYDEMYNVFEGIYPKLKEVYQTLNKGEIHKKIIEP
nr:FGGY-family carbohydrate kinase [Candidatus Freyarchaeota archaeon]